MSMLTPGDVTRFLRDQADFNILLDAVQFTEDDIEAAIDMAVSEYNAITPLTSYDQDNFPSKWLLLMGTVAHLLMSEAFLQLRNQATYQDGDVQNIGLDVKSAAYTQLAAQIKSEWKSASAEVKQQINMESAYGSLGSGYRYLYPGFGWNWDV